MPRSAKDILHRTPLRATDGEIGHVADLLFDDSSWRVRYVVADAGGWLPGRRVLIAPQALSPPDPREHVVPVSLSRQQVEDAPAAETDLPVSRQHETDLSAHYGWEPWWTSTGDPLDPGAIMLPPADVMAPGPGEVAEPTGDPHLRSADEVIGYRVHATDGEIGHVADLLVDDAWAITSLVVDTRNWRHGRSVVVPLDWIESFDWLEASVHVTVDRESVRRAPPHHED